MNVFKELARSYNQLYIPPSDDTEEMYSNVVKRGMEPELKNLSHFKTSHLDKLECLDTPAGKVLCVTIGERADFVTFLQIIANKCKPVVIPDTQGASIISGIINWKKIHDHRDEYLKTLSDDTDKDLAWSEEFRRFTSDKKNYLDVLIVLSVGPYSAVPASQVNMSDDEWIVASDTIRKYHECTHFICRKLYPELTDAIWDEVVADTIGIYAAFGAFNPEMIKTFLGIKDGHYTFGRLENYVEEEDDTQKKAKLDELSCKISDLLGEFCDIIDKSENIKPFDLIRLFEDSKESLW